MKVINNKFVELELTIGKEYPAIDIDPDATDEPIVTVINDLGKEQSYVMKRFESQ